MNFNRITTSINASVSMLGNPAKIIKPNMEKRCKNIKTIRNLCLMGIFIGFFSFAAFGILFTNFGNFELFGLIAIPFVCFMGCGIGVAVSSTKYMRYKSIVQIIENIRIKDKALIVHLPSIGTESQMIEVVQKLIETNNIVGYEIIDNKMIAKEELYISKEKANEEYDKFFMKNAMGYVPNMFYQNTMENGFNGRMSTIDNSSSETANNWENKNYYDNGFNKENNEDYNGYNTNEGQYGKNYCPSCGAPINETDKFCTNCGSRL